MSAHSDETRSAIAASEASTQSPLSVPQASAGDHTRAALRAVLGVIPWAESAATEILNYIWQQPLSKRRDEFLESVAASLNELAERQQLERRTFSTTRTLQQPSQTQHFKRYLRIKSRS